MNWQSLTTVLVAGGLTLVLIVGTVLLLLAGKRVPTEFFNLIQIGFGAVLGSSASVVAARRR